MTPVRRRIALLAALAVAASVLAHTPAAATSDTTVQAAAAGVHQPAVDALAALENVDVFAGTGCADGDGLCPHEPLSRWEMAVWLVRVIERADPPATLSRYDDVDSGEWWAAHAERLAQFGIDPGCGTRPLRFCGDRTLERGEMAGLLARAFDLPSAGSAGFADVPADHAYAADIDRVAAARITAGCETDPARYCPQQQVTRAQMATFLARAAGLVELPAPVEPAYQPDIDPTALPVDPAVRIGTLDNGLTYYLRHNDNPGKNLDLRLIVKVGSVNETDEGAGIAHFIEHMLFNGTEAYPGNALVTALRDIGVDFGPGLNAYVNQDETAFAVSLNTDPGTNVPIVFHALSQMAHAATFEDDAVASERGIVLDEMRSRRETSGGHISAEFDRIYTQGTPYEGRDPAGTVASIESMTPDDLRTFYEMWYVPSNMAVVAVGDWQVDDLEALVAEYFGPVPPGEAPAFAPVEVIPDPDPATHVVTDEEQGYSYISLDIPIPRHNAGTVGGERLQVMEQLIEVMILNRLTGAYHRGELTQVDPPSFITFDHNDALRYYGTNWQGDNLDSASTDYLSVLLTAEEHGFTSNDLSRAVEQLRVVLQFQLDSVATTQDAPYARRYQRHFLAGSDIGTVEDRVARISVLLDKLTAEDLTDHYRWLRERAGPLFIAVGPDPDSVPTTADLDAAVAAAEAGPPPAEEADVDRLMTEPAPVDAVESRPLEVLKGHEWEFANGARVMFVESQIREGVVFLEARSLGGWSLLEPGSRALSPRAAEAVLGSGLGDLSRSQVSRFLEDSTASLGAFIGETVEGFSGGSGIDDAETLFQLLHLIVTAPQVDEPAFLQAVYEAEVRTTLAEVNPRWQAIVAYNEARFGETWHRPVATREQIESLTPDALLSLFQSRLGSVDDMVVAVVGDIDADEIGRLARHYIGTLPAGDDDTFINRRPPMPEGVVRRDVSLDEGESAVLQIHHEAETPVTPLGSVAADVLEAALSERLFSVIREELGASYTAFAQIDTSHAPSPGYDSIVYVTLDPARFEEIHARVLDIIADVVANGLAPEEFAQAVAVVANDYSKISNGDLLRALLTRLYVADEDVPTPLGRARELARLSPDDVRALAGAIYGEGGRIEIVSKP